MPFRETEGQRIHNSAELGIALNPKHEHELVEREDGRGKEQGEDLPNAKDPKAKAKGKGFSKEELVKFRPDVFKCISIELGIVILERQAILLVNACERMRRYFPNASIMAAATTQNAPLKAPLHALVPLLH